MERYICIHGHFYQPPRENPWLEAIELQDSAAPYHDWNERINAECYEPNATSRILDTNDRILKIVNNYARISFNVGPTLLAWMEQHAPDTYAAVIAADIESRRRFSGHGSAMAQVYNHMIMPLANSRDKQTQVIWGLRDFERRFGRKPEGMWLAETAVDLETLEVLASYGLRYTVLAPGQASRCRKIGEAAWNDVGGARIDPTRPYRIELPSGRTLCLFFYDGPISRAVAFERLLASGETFAHRLASGFTNNRNWPQLVHIATDGETYGHHHYHGDMALAYTLDYIESHGLAKLTNYGEYLAKYPPTHEVQIYENTAWSCAHGIDRWRSDCGCNGGSGPGWRQTWREPLRMALDWLRDTLAPHFEHLGAKLLRNPWAARDEYIEVILDRTPARREAFLIRHAAHPLSADERVMAIKLLEMQRHAMLMYTSCGWFFDELSGIETVQVIQYAGRAIQLAEELFGESIEQPFLERLARAPSNIAEHGNGRRIYERMVAPARVNHRRLAAHYAVSSFFETYDRHTSLFCYAVDCNDYRRLEVDGAQLALGRASFTSRITGECEQLAFGVLHLDDLTYRGGVGSLQSDAHYLIMRAELEQAFQSGDLTEVVRLLTHHFGESTYSLQSLFRDEQRKVIGTVLDKTMSETEQLYRQLYEHQAPMMRFLVEMNAPLPKSFAAAAELVLTADLRRALESGTADSAHVQRLLAEAAGWGVGLDTSGLATTLRQSIERQISLMREQIGAGMAVAITLPLLQRAESLASTARTLPFAIDLRRTQNIYYAMAHSVYPEVLVAADQDDSDARTWSGRFAELGAALNVRVETEAEVWALKATSVVEETGRELLAARHLPRATYRLQLGPTCTFADAIALVPYLSALGISDIYASPIFTARSGSTHGYDVCDYSSVSAALGGEAGLVALSEALQSCGMGLLLDMVPNHMGIADERNRWWTDVLENGLGSAYAPFFDIDWTPVKHELEGRVLLPILADQYGRVLESGQLSLGYEDGSFLLCYYDRRLPLSPWSYRSVLNHVLNRLTETPAATPEQVQELQSILTAVGHLPPPSVSDPERQAARQREMAVVRRRIAALYAESIHVREAVDDTIRQLNGIVGLPQTFDRLDALLGEQIYRLAFWKVAGEEINYRRFFDISDLAAIRIELPQVFDEAHALVMRLLVAGHARGLRIDHADGLRDPAGYFRRLQEQYLLARLRTRQNDGVQSANEQLEPIIAAWLDAAERQDNEPARWPLYVIAEKILGPDEALPDGWAVYGTTGYDFLNLVGGLFVDSRSQQALLDCYGRFCPRRGSYHSIVNTSKKMIMLVAMAGEINALAHQLERIADQNRSYRDFTLNSLTFVLREIIAALPVYRTYVTEDGTVSARDIGVIEQAVAEAQRRNPRTDPSIFTFVRETLLLRNLKEFSEQQQQDLVSWVLKFQQLTGPIAAKGVEDTAFYTYNPLVSLNEVGGDPERFSVSQELFHRHNLTRQRYWPHTLLSTATHDTKRGEGVRARISVLSEMPAQWEEAVMAWQKLNASHKRRVDETLAPDANDEYLLYQTLIGTYQGTNPSGPSTTQQIGRIKAVATLPDGELPPIRAVDLTEVATRVANDGQVFVQRITEYMIKAVREAKVHTSWVSTNTEYEEAVRAFVAAVLEPESSFLAAFEPFWQQIAFFGQLNSLAQTLLKLTSPGVPDLYQGTELWDLSLVDPDNRRAVDYELRQRLLDELTSQVASAGSGKGALLPLARSLLDAPEDGRIKLYTILRALGFRRNYETLLSQGAYLPLEAHGPKADHVVAFARHNEHTSAIVVVPRMVVGLMAGQAKLPLGASVWADTILRLPETLTGTTYYNVFSGETFTPSAQGLALSELFANFPLALLTPQPDE